MKRPAPKKRVEVHKWIGAACGVCGREMRLWCQGADVNGAPWYSAVCKYCGAKAGPTYLELEWERQDEAEIANRQHEALEHAGEAQYDDDGDPDADPLEQIIDPHSDDPVDE